MNPDQTPFLKYYMRVATLLLISLLVITASCDSGQEGDNTRRAGYFKDADTSFQPDDNARRSGVIMKLTLADGSQKLLEQKSAISAYDDSNQIIQVSELETYQIMDGFGFAMTGGSAGHLNAMNASSRAKLLQELFGNGEDDLHLSFLRISIGASDLDAEPFSYADTKGNVPDPELNSFIIAKDEENLIPILKEILQINPDIKLMASPWSPPVWMKSNTQTIGGFLLTKYYEAYANYFVKYIKAMSDHGININFISVQNEPLHDGNNPSMHMTAEEQVAFIGGFLGPAFKKAGIDTKILAYDHNVDRIDYPLTVLSDSIANSYIQGSAYHLYGGQISDLTEVHLQHPDKDIYFTEQWYGAPGNFAVDLRWHIREVIIGATRNWSHGIIEWNLSSNPSLKPHTNGGCDQCLGAITINGDEVTRNAGYYVVGHASSFVPPGSQRISSTFHPNLPNVAFLTPENEIVLLILNDTDDAQMFSVNHKSAQFSGNLEAGSVATFKWENEI